MDAVLDRMGDVSKVILTGDYARGQDSGTILVDIFGTNLNASYLEQLSFKIEKIINRKVVFSIKSGNSDPNGLVLFEKD